MVPTLISNFLGSFPSFPNVPSSLCIRLSFCLSFRVLDSSLTAHLRHGGCKWLSPLGSPPDRIAALWPLPQTRFPVARLPPILANASGHRAGKCVCRHACMRSRV